MEYQPSGQVLNKASVTLSPPQVLAIFTTPVQIVAAPGIGLAIWTVAAFFGYTFGGTAYTDGGGQLQTQVGGTVFAAFNTLGFWDQVVSKFAYPASTRGSASSAPIINAAAVVRGTVANPTNGNGTVTVTLLYRIVPLS